MFRRPFAGGPRGPADLASGGRTGSVEVLRDDRCPAPSVTEAVRDPEGFWLLDLPALVRMKLTSYRDIDRVHVADLLSVGLIDDAVRSRLPAELGERLAKIEELSEE